MSTSSPSPTDKARHTVLELYAQRRTYDALELGCHVLRRAPHDVDIRNVLLACYARLGLSELAVQTAEGLPEGARCQPEFLSAVDQLRRLPRARVAWTAFARQFDLNLAALATRIPEAAAIRNEWNARGATGFELYRCTDGSLQICQRDSQHLPLWWPKITDHSAEMSQVHLPETKGSLQPPFLFTGMGAYHLLHKICIETYHIYLNYSPAVYVVEPDLSYVAAAFHLLDWREILSQDRFLLFVGPDAIQRFQTYLLSHEQSPIPAHRIHYTHDERSLAKRLNDVLEGIVEYRKKEADELRQEVLQYYQQKGPRSLAKRFGHADPDDPIRVLFLTSRYTTVLQYTIRDLAQGFAALGYHTSILTEEYDFACLPAAAYLRTLRDFLPDLVVIPDHLRTEHGATFPPQLLAATWMQDRLPNLLSPEAGQSVRTTCSEPGEPDLVAPTDYPFGYFRQELTREYGYPADTYLFYPIIPGNPQLYHPVEVTSDQSARYGCDVTFLSNSGKPFDQGLSEVLDACLPQTHRVVEAVFETVRDRYRSGGGLLCRTELASLNQLQKLAESQASSMGIDPALMKGFDLRFNLLNDWLWRYATLEWLVDMDIDLHLHGQGWDRHPRFSRAARPPINDPAEISALYASARIALQIGAYGSMHQRMITGLFAGGFFLARETSYNYGAFDHLHPEMHEEPVLLDRRLAGLNALMELSRRDCTSFEEFIAPENAALLKDLCPIAGQSLPPHLRNDLSALWEHVDLLMSIIPAAVFPDCWNEVAFWTRQEMADRLDRFLHRDSERRKEVAAYMRQRCLARHGPEPLVRRLIQHICGCLKRAVRDGGSPSCNG